MHINTVKVSASLLFLLTIFLLTNFSPQYMHTDIFLSFLFSTLDNITWQNFVLCQVLPRVLKFSDRTFSRICHPSKQGTRYDSSEWIKFDGAQILVSSLDSDEWMLLSSVPCPVQIGNSTSGKKYNKIFFFLLGDGQLGEPCSIWCSFFSLLRETNGNVCTKLNTFCSCS